MELTLFPEEEKTKPEITVDGGALFNGDRTHRIKLWRIWDVSKPMIMYIGLNPSRANEDTTDATITRLINFSKRFDAGGMYMMNVFTYVTPYPWLLGELVVTPEEVLKQIADHCAKVVFCWGNFRQSRNRAKQLSALFPSALCFGKNKNGTPKHPLYLQSGTPLEKYSL